MTLPNNIEAYRDCFDLLDRAVTADNGIKVRVESWDAGNHLRSRLHYSRSLQRMKNREVYMLGDAEYGTSGYDHLFIQIVEDDGWWLTIKPRVVTGEVVEL